MKYKWIWNMKYIWNIEYKDVMKILGLAQSLIFHKKTISSVPNRAYVMINHTGENLNCHSKNLVYLLTFWLINTIGFGNSRPNSHKNELLPNC